MEATLIGISSGILLIVLFGVLKQFDKQLIYGLILCGIGFLYVGFVWTNVPAMIINALQAILFVFIAYYGTKKNLNLLAAGYFLHGIWDIVYGFFQDPALIPPHYDLFCLSIDFTIGCYILIFAYRTTISSGRLKTTIPS